MAWESLWKEKLQFMEHNRKVSDAVSSIVATEAWYAGQEGTAVPS
jgi:hypothetical protein